MKIFVILELIIIKKNIIDNLIDSVELLFKKIMVMFRCGRRKYVCVNQFCKKCGSEMGYDFSVPDEVWVNLPEEYQNHVLCLHCFLSEYPDKIDDLNIKLYG